MTILLFIAIIAVLVLSHEFGHFLAAKLSGVKVEEFGFGFPPRLFAWRRGETTYSFNLIPFGGFVKLLGESAEEEVPPEDLKKSFSAKPKSIRAVIVAAGVFFNLILAWFLFSLGFLSGMPMPLGAAPPGAIVEKAVLTVMSVRPDSPAETAGLTAGDIILGLTALNSGEVLAAPTPEQVQEFIFANGNESMKIAYSRGRDKKEEEIKPAFGVIPDRPAIGVAMEMVGKVRLPFFQAFFEGLKTTFSVAAATSKALLSLIGQALQGKATAEAITGPIGIISVVGDASVFGFVYLIGLTALISINLAVINIIPVPALDGGHLLFLFIEAVLGRPLPVKTLAFVNRLGFTLLLFLLLVITVFDALKLAAS